MKKLKRHKHEVCPNCNNALHEDWEFCPICGQSVYEIKGSVKYLINEVTGNLYSFDSKLFRTIIRLFTKPGIVASEFASGKMARFVPPIRLYIFTTILFFLVLSLNKCTREPDDTVEKHVNPKSTYRNIKMTNEDYKRLKSFNDTQIDSFIVANGEKANLINRFGLKKTIKIAESGIDPFIEEIKTNATFGMFLLMPVSGFILYIFFRKKRRYYFDHVIAAVYLHTAIFILFTVSQLLSFVIQFDGFVYVLFLFYIYMIWSLRNFYTIRWISAILKSIPIVASYFIFLIIFIVAVTLASVVTF